MYLSWHIYINQHTPYCCYCSVTQSCCNPMPPCLHPLQELAQTHASQKAVSPHLCTPSMAIPTAGSKQHFEFFLFLTNLLSSF